jgi:hypothetical protein
LVLHTASCGRVACLEVTLAAADVLRGCGEVTRQRVHQRRQSDTFVTVTADGHLWRLEGENVIQCYKLTDSKGSGNREVSECRKLRLGK